MALNILIVDDSTFFQRLLSEIINEHPKLHVIGVANNGNEAIQKVKSLKPDVVTMDYEMPMMDGVTAVREIMAENPLPILMLSSMTFSGAKITMDALDAGAADFMTKNFAEISGKSATIKKRLYDTLLALGKSVLLSSADTSNEEKNQPALVNNQSAIKPIKKGALVGSTIKKGLFESSETPKVIAIGASTGGPAALTKLLEKIPASFPFPILIIQHMPSNFTLAFSQRLNKQCNIEVKEAENGDKLVPGKALLAPGGKQLIIDAKDPTKVKVIESEKDINYKPCVDVSLASLSNTYGKSTLAIVLTGMGNDGHDGAYLLKQKQATVWTQTEESCVVYGMPMAIENANLSNASLSLEKMAYHLCSI